ncbi:MAG: hypothetical protein K2I79_03165, partial [Clostridia bacterium]|nr:hypothetical protein [Clostridia bacterium]
RNALQGIGKSGLVVFAGVTELIMRVLASVFLVSSFGYLGICLSNPTAWVGADVFLLISYFIIINKMKKNKSWITSDTPSKQTCDNTLSPSAIEENEDKAELKSA